MAEMPFDVINGHLHTFREEGYFTQSSDIEVPDPVDLAIDIDSELQKQFLFFPFEEIDEVEIHIHGKGEKISAGTGPEECSATGTENPDWLYNHAVNALALWRTLKQRQETERRGKRPQHGWYVAKSDTAAITVFVTAEDRRVMMILPFSGELEDVTANYDRGVYKSWEWSTLSSKLAAEGLAFNPMFRETK